MENFTKFYDGLSHNQKKFTIAFKNESLLMRIIGKILFFNKDFMTNFITTIGTTIYFPNSELLEKGNEYNNIAVLAHEYVHVSDSKKYGQMIFSFFYLFPLSIALFMLLLLPISYILSIALFILFLLPLPAYWRKHFELRAYKMSLFVYNELAKKNKVSEINRYKMLIAASKEFNKHFTGSTYYFMWPFGVKKELLKSINNIIVGDILSEDRLYSEVSEVLNELKL